MKKIFTTVLIIFFYFLPKNVQSEIKPIIEGNIELDEIIKINDNEVGKIINNSKFAFGLFKFKDPNFKIEKILTTNKAKIKIKKPFWI